MKILPLPIVVGLVNVFLIPQFASAGTATEVVERLQASLIEVMKEGKSLTYEGRYRRLESVVEATHDIPFIAKLTVSKYWRTWNDEQHARFLDSFTKLSIATYASRFGEYSNESFTTVSEKEISKGNQLVESTFRESNGNQIHFQYILHQRREHWLILNIVVDGVSDLALKRTEYNSIIEKEGFAGLISKIDNQIAQYAAGL